jgi:hypothetical protein
MEENKIPQNVLHINLGTTRLRSRSKNRRQDGVREDGGIVGEVWQEKVRNGRERQGIVAFCTCQRNGYIHNNAQLHVQFCVI